ncbi:hypothetical protein AMELA_G00004910 [Ameiurus melas]|uniref:HTH CENPB-type domain-containing protein n=1 Tax=Ameiurus melas TaxID=219545 RepID=A0A7J6BIX5_AMEME|nr:hypothetical protein AMELA_G00004910 [Ameiurus melas]
MTNLQSLSIFLTERLMLAAQEIFKAVEVTVTEYHDEISRSRQENELLKSRLLEAGIQVYPELQPGLSVFHGETSAGSERGDQDEKIDVKQEPSASREEPRVPPPQTSVPEEPVSPTACLEDEQRIEELLHPQMTDSSASPLVRAHQCMQIKEETDESRSGLGADIFCVSQSSTSDDPSSANASNHTSGLETELDGLSSMHNASQDPKMAPVKRHAYEAAFKLKAIRHAVEHGNRAAAREFNINESMVRKWRKQEEDLHQVKKTKLSFRGNKARWQQLEDILEHWVIEQRTAGRSVSTVSIRLKATAVARDMKITDFRGGPSWCFRFMKRRNLSIRTRPTISQRLPKDYEEKLAIFRTYCKNKITEKKIRPEHITTMDEVPLTFDIPVNRTVQKTGTSTVSIRTTGNEKSSFTVVLGCQANGQKLPPMVIFKRKTLPREKFPAGVIIKANPKGWMDEEKMSEWLREVYVRRPDGFSHKSPSLLICDSIRAHLTDTVKTQVKQTNSELAIIPGGLTKELQPLDIGVTRSFKVKLRAAWEHWMTEGEHTFTKTGKQRWASYATICQWIVDAWAKVSVSSIVRAFMKGGIITKQLSNSNETDSDNDERDLGMVDAEIAQLFTSDTEDEEFDGFVEEQ